MQNKVAIVTGGSKGIGKSAALAFARKGASVVVADLDEEHGNKVVEEIKALDGRAIFVKTNVAVDAECEHLVKRTVEEFGRLDYAFNNAGIEGTPARTTDCSLDNWRRTLDINLAGTFYCMRHQIPVMQANGGGSVVNMASIAGLKGIVNLPAYCASKHAVVGLTKTAALEYAAENIRINVVCPGGVETEMVQRFSGGSAEAMEQMHKMHPMGHMAKPEDIANAVVWLCSEEASFVTGVALPLDGGVMAGG